MKTQSVPISPRVGFNALLFRPTTGGTEQIQLGILRLSFRLSVVVRNNVFGGNWVLAQASGPKTVYRPAALTFQSRGAVAMS